MEIEKKTKEKKLKRVKKSPTKTDTSKVYELALILLPNLSNEKMLDEFTLISKEITSKGGEIISSENPVLIDLAYPMLKVVTVERHKCDQGYFGWVKFEMESEIIIDIKKFLDLSSTVLRFMIIKTVRENTMLNGKMGFKKDDRIKNSPVMIEDGLVDDVSSDILTINEDEIDKSIDELVIV